MRALLKSASILLILSLILSLCACGATVINHCELHITLSPDYTEYDSDGSYDLSYSDGRLIVGILRFSHAACLEDGVPITLTPLKFAEFYRSRAEGAEGLSAVDEHGDIPYFTYTLTGESGTQYTYMPTFYKSYYAYFLVMFITPSELYEGTRVEIFDIIEGVYLVNDKAEQTK